MSKSLILALLGCLLAPTIVESTCGQCYTSHACVSRSTFQICLNGERVESTTYSCPDAKPICTAYGIICMEQEAAVPQACGDVSKCEACGADDIFACTSRNTFAKCNAGAITAGRGTCGKGFICSAAGAAAGNPCITQCHPNPDDICDKATEGGPADEEPTTTPNDNTGPTTELPNTVSPGPVGSFCEATATIGRFATPNDVECTSYIYCFARGGTWQGVTYNCPASNSYFNATATSCGSNKPTGAGCV